VLENLSRAVQKGRECIFVVEPGNAEKLERIISDPVNRQGSEHHDDEGSFSYYTDSQGQPFDQIRRLEDAEYRILVASNDGVTQYDPAKVDSGDSDPDQTDIGNRFDEVQEIGHTVLTQIKEGNDDTHRITSATQLPNHKVNYRLTKLEELGLINVEDAVGPVKREANGQKRVFKVKPVSLTEKADVLPMEQRKDTEKILRR